MLPLQLYQTQRECKLIMFSAFICYASICTGTPTHAQAFALICQPRPPAPPVKVHKAPLKSNGRSLPITPPEPTSIFSILPRAASDLSHAPSTLCNTPPPSPPLSSPIPSTRAENGGCTVNFWGGGKGRGQVQSLCRADEEER